MEIISLLALNNPLTEIFVLNSAGLEVCIPQRSRLLLLRDVSFHWIGIWDCLLASVDFSRHCINRQQRMWFYRLQVLSIKEKSRCCNATEWGREVTVWTPGNSVVCLLLCLCPAISPLVTTATKFRIPKIQGLLKKNWTWNGEWKNDTTNANYSFVTNYSRKDCSRLFLAWFCIYVKYILSKY